jgi:hypothetical protein
MRYRAIVRSMRAKLERMGMPEDARPDVWVLRHWDTPADMAAAFATESILYAFNELLLGDRCDWRVVVRCLVQAKGYNAKAEAFRLHTGPDTFDAITELSNVVQDRVSGR